MSDEIPRLPYQGDPLETLVNDDFNAGVEHGKRLEREACARIADSYAQAPLYASKNSSDPHLLHSLGTGAECAKRIAEVIRRRGTATS